MSLVVDARGLPPPEPFERTMEALDQLQPGETLLLLLYREPFPLYDVLSRNGFSHRASLGEDGTYSIYIQHATL